MAGKKPKKPKPRSGRWQRGDLEALALVLLAAAFFLAASLYPEPPLSGALGRDLKRFALEHLGYVAYLVPLPIFAAGALMLFGRPVRRTLRHGFFLLLTGSLSLPFVGLFDERGSGRWGRLARDWIREQLGDPGFLLLALLIWAVLDVWTGRPPFWGLLQVLRRVGLAVVRLFRAWREQRARTRAWGHVRRQARELLAEVRTLGARYPDHAMLAELKSDLERLARQGTREEETELQRHRDLLEAFREQRAAELLARLRAEGPDWLPELEALKRVLQNPLALASSPLVRELEERRSALQLELATLEKRAADLSAAVERDVRSLESGPGSLSAVARRREERFGRWQDLRDALDEVAGRVEAWERWVAWAELHPEDAHAEALERLRQGGLVASPPAAGEADDEPTPEPPPSRPAAPPAKAPAANPAKPVKSVPASRKPALPALELLDPPEPKRTGGKELEEEAARRAEVINETLSHFNLAARVVDWARGPSVTRFEVEPAPGEKISRIAGLANDIARALAVGSVRVEAPIPGKHVIGLEVPNAERDLVRFSEALNHAAYQRSKDRLPLILGKSIDGEMWVRDLAVMPHLLIAGSTGSGKSVCVNTLVMSLLYRYLPSELRLLMIDPKMVELTPYDGIPHLVRGVVTNPADAAGVLLGAVAHMERRYKLMSQVGARNLEQFNAKMRELGEPELPLLVIVIDELADLMITSPKEVEQAILRLAQMARATGMHLVLATQRPSVDILTSLIKVNVPARIAFAVSSTHDSRTILDSTGAERLIGQGDMLFHQPGLPKPVRLQGPFLSDREIRRVTEYLRAQEFEDVFGEAYGADFDGPLALGVNTDAVQGELPLDFSDPYLKRAAEIVVEEGQASVSRLQRRLSVGHARAGKLMDLLEAVGIVGPHQGSKPREVLITREQIEEYFG